MESNSRHHGSSDSLDLLLSSLTISSTPESVDLSPQSYPAPVSESWNVDIMHIVMSYANRRVISNLMKTCNVLNSEGTKYLLADGVILRRESEVVSFMWFLQARGNSSECIRRLKIINNFWLDFYDPQEHIAHVLAMFFDIIVQLGAASNFTSLKIYQAEALLKTHPPLAAAIAKLTTLKTLNLQYIGVHGATLLRTLQSSLVTATVTFCISDGEGENGVIPEPDTNPILLLEGSQSTLESLTTCFALSTPDGPYYPNVTRLDLSCMDFPYIEDYIRAFPNIVSLKAFECNPYRDEPELWQGRQEMTMLYQAEQGTWRSLCDYQGSMLTLWLWGLTCHIPSVALSFDQQYGVNPNFLNDIVLDTRPSHLSLRLPGASCLLDDAVRTVLSEEGRLQVLELCVVFHLDKKDETVSVKKILDLLTDVVRASSVPSFKLILDLSYIRMFRRRRSGEGLPVMPFETYLQDMAVGAYADTLFASVPSLKEVHVSIEDPFLEDRCTRQAERRRMDPDRHKTASEDSKDGAQ